MAKTEPEQLAFPRAKTLGKIGLAPFSPLKKDLARIYRQARDTANLTQRELADALTKATGRQVQQKFITYCESESEPETFSSAQITGGPSAWSVPIFTGMVAFHSAQLIRAVEIKHPTHALRLAHVMRSGSNVAVEYSTAIAREQEDHSVATLETNLRAIRAAQDDLLEAERALSVALVRERGAK